MYTSIQIPSCAGERCKSIQKRTKDGIIHSKNFHSPILTENFFGIDRCFEWWNSEKTRWQMYHTLQCDSSNTERLFAQFTQQSSSVSTEQFQAGVKSSLNGPRIKKSRLWRSSRQKKMSSSWKMCEAARSEFFGASSKERQSGIWKQIARTSSEIWNTRQRNSIYESLWICDIPENGLYRDELQNNSWRRWWFWRSTSACREIQIQNPCNESRTTCNWTISSSSYHTISWHQRYWNSDSLSKILGGFMPR